VQGGQSVAGDGQRRVEGEQAGLDEAAEVTEIAVPPVGLVLRGPGTHRVDGA
jgi:hypothetical protein